MDISQLILQLTPIMPSTTSITTNTSTPFTQALPESGLFFIERQQSEHHFVLRQGNQRFLTHSSQLLKPGKWVLLQQNNQTGAWESFQLPQVTRFTQLWQTLSQTTQNPQLAMRQILESLAEQPSQEALKQLAKSLGNAEAFVQLAMESGQTEANAIKQWHQIQGWFMEPPQWIIPFEFGDRIIPLWVKWIKHQSKKNEQKKKEQKSGVEIHSRIPVIGPGLLRVRWQPSWSIEMAFEDSHWHTTIEPNISTIQQTMKTKLNLDITISMIKYPMDGLPDIPWETIA